MNNNQKTIDYADRYGMKTVETTSEASGYPRNLRHVLTFQTITELLNCSEELTAEGHTVTELLLHKRDGWQLWARTRGSIEHGMFRRASDNDWTIEVDASEDPKDVAFRLLFDGVELDSLDGIRGRLAAADRFAEEVENIIEASRDNNCDEVTIFYDPDQNYRIDYWADNDTVGYSYDTHAYEVALMVDWKEDDND